MKDLVNAIELKGISKYFGNVTANNNINLSAKQGEILALLGENGSGKTTLMNMLSGIYRPDSGFVFVHGKEVTISSPRDSFNLGIGMIHQHFKLVEVMSARDNIILGTKNRKKLRFKELTDEVNDICKHFGLEIDIKKKIHTMSVSEKQTVEILKVLYRGAKILILDEPTAVLTPQETEKLFDILRKMRDEGCSIIIITHKLNEVMEISNRVTVLRKGESVKTVNTAETSARELTSLMVGKSVDLSIDRPQPKKKLNLLKVNHLFANGDDGTPALKDVTFTLHGGEILGVAGVAGSGQKELCEVIAGLRTAEKGSVIYDFDNILGKTPDEIIAKGISMSFIPEDRLGMGLVPSMGIVDNLMLKTYRKSKGAFVSKKSSKALAKSLVERLGIVTGGLEAPVSLMSGGNVQKVLLGREIESNPNVLITAYPVRGLDINSSFTIYDLLNEQKKKGVGVLFIGEDLDVLLELCDRIIILYGGKITGIVEAKSATKELLGHHMTGNLSPKGGAQ